MPPRKRRTRKAFVPVKDLVGIELAKTESVAVETRDPETFDYADLATPLETMMAEAHARVPVLEERVRVAIEERNNLLRFIAGAERALGKADEMPQDAPRTTAGVSGGSFGAWTFIPLHG